MFHLGGEGGGEEAAESNTATVGDEQREEGDEPPKLLPKQVVHLSVDVMCLSPDLRGSVICMCCVVVCCSERVNRYGHQTASLLKQCLGIYDF